jgi:hypothetical protein
LNLSHPGEKPHTVATAQKPYDGPTDILANKIRDAVLRQFFALLRAERAKGRNFTVDELIHKFDPIESETQRAVARKIGVSAKTVHKRITRLWVLWAIFQRGISNKIKDLIEQSGNDRHAK